MATRKKASADDKERLRALIEDATVDCYGEDEQFSGLCCMIDEEVVFPFKAKVIGEEVTVTRLEPVDNGFALMATCERNGKKYQVDVNSLEWVKPYPEGFERIEAYLAWREWNG